MKGRKLRLLVLNDVVRAVPKPRLLSVVKVPDGHGGSLPCIQNLHQHMQLWATRSAPEFDLLLVDIKFEGDGYAPDYFGQEMNPYGLLHALPLAARQGLTGLPFVWDIHTGQPKMVQDDPVAQFAFGLLAAMEQRQIGGDNPWRWDGYLTSLSATHFRDGIEKLGKSDPDDRIGELVKRYRVKLIEQIEAGKLWTDLSVVKRLQNLLANENRKDLAASTLLIYCDGHPEQEFCLQSLFADVLGDIIGFSDSEGFVDAWPKGNPWDEVKSFVEKLHAAIWLSVPVDHLYKLVGQMLAELPQAHENGLGAYLKGKRYKEFIIIGTVICCWLDRFYRGESTTHKSIKAAAAIDAQNDHTIHDNLAALGLNYSGQQFIDSLSRMILPQPFKALGEIYWKTLIGEGTKRPKARPRCIEAESAEAVMNG